MALRWKAIELERVTGHRVRRRVEIRLTGSPRELDGDCPSVDEILAFCEGQAPFELSQSVRHHLDVCDACVNLVTGALSDWEPPKRVDWGNVACNFRRGDRVEGRFEIVRFLSRGGMGEVYEAIDTHSSARVALKAVLAAACDNHYMLASFRRESRLARRVRHPNVCRVQPAPRTTTSPVPFFSMEFIEGKTLTEVLLRGPLALEHTLRVARQLLLGLRAIHHSGVLHLDIKSSNIMLRDGRPSEAIILDFGLARSVRGAARQRGARPLTGSLAYMPPEQILGRSPGFRNDVFAFGVVLFQMLTGRMPFPTTEPSAASSLVRRLTAEAPLPSHVIPTLPRWLDDMVRICLADQALRFEDMPAVLEVLESH